EDIYYSWKIDTKPNRSFSDETIYSTRTIKDEKYVVKKYKDIYDMSSIDIEKKLFLEKSKENILMYKNDRQTFELLKKAYNQYKHEKYPFAVYKESHGPLRKYSKKNNGPVIKNIKYIDKKLGSHIDVSHKYNTNQKNVVLLQISPYRTDFYQNLDGTYKFVTIKYANLKPEKTDYFIDENWYNEQKKIKEIDEDAKFLFSMHRNEIIELKQKDQKSIKYRFIGTNNDKRNKIEVNPITYHEQKQLMPTIGKKTTSIKKYATNSIGRMYEIKNELLKLRV
ncbi:MAG: type II CRISPR RNA-guided endonuclease Cas9, partial [bacterium]